MKGGRKMMKENEEINSDNSKKSDEKLLESKIAELEESLQQKDLQIANYQTLTSLEDVKSYRLMLLNVLTEIKGVLDERLNSINRKLIDTNKLLALQKEIEAE